MCRRLALAKPKPEWVPVIESAIFDNRTIADAIVFGGSVVLDWLLVACRENI